MRLGFKGLDNKARRIDKVYVGVDNIARKCVKGYVGVNGVATLIYPVDQPIPTVTGHFVYDRNFHEAEISDYDPEMIEVIGTTQTSQAGRHTVTFKLKSPLYRWMDGTTTPKSSTWVIDKARVTPPTVTTKDYVYNGSLYTAVISNYDPYAIEVSGQTAINAGTHNVVLKLTNTNNYVWSDGSSASKSFPWVISPAKVAVPSVTGSYTYSGKAQSAVISAYDKTVIKVSGTTSATNAGSYAVKFNLTNTTNYRWTDNTITEKSKTWTIAKLTIAVPKVTSSLVYNGKEQTATVEKYNENLISEGGTRKGTVAGSYAVTFSLKDTTNYTWVGGSISKQSVSWSIGKKSLAIPVVSSNLTYNGNTQKPTVTNAPAAEVKQGGQTDGVNAGTYTITFDLIDTKNTQWSDGKTTRKSGTWSIGKKSVAVPYLTGSTAFTYDGQNHSVTVSNYDSTLINVSGTLTAQNAGTYTVKYNLYSGVTTNYQWADGSITQKTSTWAIAQKAIAVPTLSGSYTYNGAEQAVTISGLVSGVSVGGTQKATKAGTYVVKFNVSSNYKWNDNTRAEKTASWSINKKRVAIPTLSFNSQYYSGYTKRPLEGVDTSFINVSGTTEAKNVGVYTIYYSVDGNNVVWNDGTNSRKSATWKILKTNINLSVWLANYSPATGYFQTWADIRIYNQDDEFMDLYASVNISGAWTWSGQVFNGSRSDSSPWLARYAGTVSASASIGGTANYNSASASYSITI